MSLITTYQPLPVSFTHGEGVWLYDNEGKAYLDGLSGIAVCGLGHAHPEITDTIAKQASMLMHCSNTYLIDAQEQLAEKLTQKTQMSQVFFANSGAEANEAAIKLCRLYGRKKNIDIPTIIVMQRAFHGRSMATISASGNPKLKAGFDPLLLGFVQVPINDVQALQKIAQERNDIVAVMLEPIQGEGGVIVATDQYLRAIQSLCKQQDWLLICDEVQTGNARTGTYFAYEHAGILPDIVTTAKGLGNGMPISACLMRDKACDLFSVGSHGSTFGGNALACATALKVIEIIERDKLCEHVSSHAQYLYEQLEQALGNKPFIKAIRGRGFMLGIECDRPIMDMRHNGLKEGVLFGVTAESVIRLLPPLIISRHEIDELVLRLTKSIDGFYRD